MSTHNIQASELNQEQVAALTFDEDKKKTANALQNKIGQMMMKKKNDSSDNFTKQNWGKEVFNLWESLKI